MMTICHGNPFSITGESTHVWPVVPLTKTDQLCKTSIFYLLQTWTIYWTNIYIAFETPRRSCHYDILRTRCMETDEILPGPWCKTNNCCPGRHNDHQYRANTHLRTSPRANIWPYHIGAKQNGPHDANDTSKCIFLNETLCVFIQRSLEFFQGLHWR